MGRGRAPGHSANLNLKVRVPGGGPAQGRRGHPPGPRPRRPSYYGTRGGDSDVTKIKGVAGPGPTWRDSD